jgi:uncharacterized hydrophobic protein (TIGR00271 family)
MQDNSIPDYARTVLVPIANPNTAPTLLELASRMVHPDGGRMLALFISRGEAETETELLEQIELSLDALRAEGTPVSLLTRVSTSISRGILDVAREERADLLVLGVRQTGRGRTGFDKIVEGITTLLPGQTRPQAKEPVSLGNVVESVAAIAPCDMLIYRASREPKFTHIVVPVDGSLDARVACRMAILLGSGYQAPVNAIYVQESFRPQWEGRGRIEQSLAGLPEAHTVTRTLVSANDAASGVLSRLDAEDLLVIGVSKPSTLDRWLYGDAMGHLVNHAPGPVILVKRSIPQNNLAGRMERLAQRFSLTLTQVEREEMLWQAEEMASPYLDYSVLILVSAVLASLGLLLNNQAVIIGAMLVAPLMQPLMGLAVGGATGRIQLMGRALATLVQGVMVALVISALIGLLYGNHTPTAEMLSRGNSGWLDIGVALASGFVGAYAMARKDIPGVLAGVAIAAALMPPLCTVGLSIGAGNAELSAHSAILFLMNIVCISLAAWVVFLWLGMRPSLVRNSEHTE